MLDETVPPVVIKLVCGQIVVYTDVISITVIS